VHKILIVDDSATIRATVAAELTYKKAEILQAATAVDAVKLFEAERPALVFLDINLPAADGFVVLKRIRALDPSREAKVIMLTSVTNKETIQKALESGADDYVAKPFQAVILRDKTDKFLK